MNSILSEFTDEKLDFEFITKEEADTSFDDFWANFDYTRTSSSAYMLREDKAPWFSEYVRRELGNMIYGSDDIYTSGFTVNTTLNLEGRHDPAIIHRARAVVDAVSAIVVADMLTTRYGTDYLATKE